MPSTPTIFKVTSKNPQTRPLLPPESAPLAGAVGTERQNGVHPRVRARLQGHGSHVVPSFLHPTQGSNPGLPHCRHIDMGFPGGSDSKESACNAGNLGSIRGLRTSPGGRHGNPL